MSQSSLNTKDMPREDWLEARRTGIGGSDAAAIMGMNPYKTPLCVYVDKVTEPEELDTTAIRRGIALEDFVAKEFERETGKRVRRKNAMLRHPDYPFMIANVDRMVVGERALLECKTTTYSNKTKFGDGDVSPVYYWQCQHYMAVTGHSMCYLAVYVVPSSFHVIEVQRHEEHIGILIEAEKEFWFNHVLTQQPPLPDGSEIDDEAIKLLFAGEKRNAEIAMLDEDDNVRKALDSLPALKEKMDNAKRGYEETKQALKLAMGTHAIASCGEWQITFKEQNTTRLNQDALKSAMPDIYKRFCTTTTSRVLRTKQIGMKGV